MGIRGKKRKTQKKKSEKKKKQTNLGAEAPGKGPVHPTLYVHVHIFKRITFSSVRASGVIKRDHFSRAAKQTAGEKDGRETREKKDDDEK